MLRVNTNQLSAIGEHLAAKAITQAVSTVEAAYAGWAKTKGREGVEAFVRATFLFCENYNIRKEANKYKVLHCRIKHPFDHLKEPAIKACIAISAGSEDKRVDDYYWLLETELYKLKRAEYDKALIQKHSR